MKAQAGLTLIEIAFVIVLLGLLAALALNTLGGGANNLARLLEAEDRVLAELRRARAAAFAQLPAADSGDNPTVTAAINARAPGANVCPETVEFPYESLGAVGSVTCNRCMPCDGTAPYEIVITSGDRSRCVSVNAVTGRAESTSCGN